MIGQRTGGGRSIGNAISRPARARLLGWSPKPATSGSGPRKKVADVAVGVRRLLAIVSRRDQAHPSDSPGAKSGAATFCLMVWGPPRTSPFPDGEAGGGPSCQPVPFDLREERRGYVWGAHRYGSRSVRVEVGGGLLLGGPGPGRPASRSPPARGRRRRWWCRCRCPELELPRRAVASSRPATERASNPTVEELGSTGTVPATGQTEHHLVDLERELRGLEGAGALLG